MIQIRFEEREKIGLQYILESLHGCSPFGQERIRQMQERKVLEESLELARLVQDAFMNDYFRVYTSYDIIGVELAADISLDLHSSQQEEHDAETATKEGVACFGACEGLVQAGVVFCLKVIFPAGQTL